MTDKAGQSDFVRELHRVWSNRPGWGSLSAVNHSTIGLRFLFTGMVFFLIGGVLAMLVRTQLALPGQNLLSAELYNQAFTMHGTVMMFLFAIPVLEGLAIYLIPKFIGARDLVFPRISSLGYYCYLFGGIIIMSSLFLGIAPDSGWFMYTPLSSDTFSPGPGSDFWLLGITFVEISAMAAGIELTVSILRTRAPGMTLSQMPIFCWYILAMALMIVFGFPPLILASILLELERAAGMPFFDVTAGGDPLLWQHLFWLFGHPEVYIIFLPAAGCRYRIDPDSGVLRATAGGVSLDCTVRHSHRFHQFRALGASHVYRGHSPVGSGFFLGDQHDGGRAYGHSGVRLAGHVVDGQGGVSPADALDNGLSGHFRLWWPDRGHAGAGAVQLAGARYALCGGAHALRAGRRHVLPAGGGLVLLVAAGIRAYAIAADGSIGFLADLYWL